MLITKHETHLKCIFIKWAYISVWSVHFYKTGWKRKSTKIIFQKVLLYIITFHASIIQGKDKRFVIKNINLPFGKLFNAIKFHCFFHPNTKYSQIIHMPFYGNDGEDILKSLQWYVRFQFFWSSDIRIGRFITQHEGYSNERFMCCII